MKDTIEMDSLGFCRWQDELRHRLLSIEKVIRVLLAFAGLLGFVASSSELWLTSSLSFFSKLPDLPNGLLTPGILFFILVSLYCENWKRTCERWDWKSGIGYGLISAGVDVLIMCLVTYGVYLGINELTIVTLPISWKLLYLAVPLSIGEFALTSMISKLLQKTISLEKKIDEDGRSLQELVQRASKIPQEGLRTSERSQIIRDFVKDTLEQQGGEEDDRESG